MNISFPRTCSLSLLLACIILPTAHSAPPSVSAAALVVEGHRFQANGQFIEALWAYRQAANTGHVAGAFAAGNGLIAQGLASQGRDRALQFSEGLGYLYFAATNHHSPACIRLAEALQHGLGVQTNLVTAYAWLAVAAKYDAAYQPDLDQLVVRLEPAEVLQAQQTAKEYTRGQWPPPLAFAIKQGDDRLQLQGLSLGKMPLATLNGKTFTAGETIAVASAKAPKTATTSRLNVSCLEIGSDYILLAIAGEPNRILLSSNTR